MTRKALRSISSVADRADVLCSAATRSAGGLQEYCRTATVIIVIIEEIITHAGILEMKRTILLGASVAIGTTIAWTMLTPPGAAQSPPPYNPYPDGILPVKLLSEIHRVQREVKGIFQQYLQQWQA